jgi:hypothetical protein
MTLTRNSGFTSSCVWYTVTSMCIKKQDFAHKLSLGSRPTIRKSPGNLYVWHALTLEVFSLPREKSDCSQNVGLLVSQQLMWLLATESSTESCSPSGTVIIRMQVVFAAVTAVLRAYAGPQSPSPRVFGLRQTHRHRHRSVKDE